MPSTVDTLSEKFPIPGLQFQTGEGGLIRAIIHTPLSDGELYLHGAHLTHFQPAGQKPVLWMSESSLFEDGKPIRGGVPICFPWFGPHPTDPKAPGHGFARIQAWELTDAKSLPDGAVYVELKTNVSPFDLTYQVTFASTLKLSLQVTLDPNSKSPATFEEALHTYLDINDIRSIFVEGLENTPFIDKVDNAKRKEATGAPIRFDGECDRVYLNTTSPCIVHDPLNRRKIVVTKDASKSTVVWNPWINKSAKMPDFGDHEWTGMLCIETANVGDHAIELHPGKSHVMMASIEVQALV